MLRIDPFHCVVFVSVHEVSWRSFTVPKHLNDGLMGLVGEHVIVNLGLSYFFRPCDGCLSVQHAAPTRDALKIIVVRHAVVVRNAREPICI